MDLEFEEEDKFTGHLEFGQCSTNKAIKFIQIIDLDDSILNVPFISYNETLEDLKKSYLEMSKCKKLIGKYRVSFIQVLQKKSVLLLDGTKIGQVYEGKKIKRIKAKLIQQNQEGHAKSELVYQFEQKSGGDLTIPFIIRSLMNKRCQLVMFSANNTIRQIQIAVAQLLDVDKLQIGMRINDQHLSEYDKNLTIGESLGDLPKNRAHQIIVFNRFVGGCFASDSKIMLADFSYKKISELRMGMKINSLNIQNFTAQEDEIINIHSTDVEQQAIIQLEDGRSIRCTANHTFLTASKEWLRCAYREGQKRLQKGDKLLDITQKDIKISQITIKRIKQEKFYHICTQKNHNFIVQGFIAHNMTLNVRKQNGKVLQINADPSTSIFTLKLKIHQLEGIPPQQQTIIYAGKQLDVLKTLKDYQLIKQGTVDLVINKNKKDNIFEFLKKSQRIERIQFKLSQTEMVQVPYYLIKDDNVRQALSKVIPHSQPYYSVIFGKHILEPTTKIRIVQQFLQFNCFPSILMIVVKSSEKMTFYKAIKQKVRFPKKQFPLDKMTQSQINAAAKRILTKTQNKSTNEQFYTPILYYTCNKFYKKINSALSTLKFCQFDIFSSEQIRFAASLTQSLKMMPNYIGKTYRGINELRFSQYQKVGDVFYWKGFTSTSKRVQIAKNFKKKKGSLFLISSLTGKDISAHSVYETQEQILFMPFTYFIVENIIKHDEYDEVQLAQMPTPNYFNRNLIIWVDDNPSNNLNYIETINNQRTEVMQLSSTNMAAKWTAQFSWILNLMDVKFKVISDMVRKESSGMNYQAGIDLLQLFYNIQGYSTPIMIFCSDVQKAKENCNKRNIRKNNIYKITNYVADVQKYAQFS